MPSRTTGPVDWSPTVVVCLYAVTVMAAMLQFFSSARQNSGWLDAALLMLAVAANIAALAKQLPVINVVFAAGIAAGIGGVAHAVNDVTGIPFGRLEFSTAFGPRLLGVLPLAVPALWAMAALSTRGVARVTLRSSHTHPFHGYRVIGLAVILMIVLQAALDPFGAIVKGWWSASSSPVLNLASQTVLGLVIQVMITPLLLDKFPGPRPPNFWPLAVWLVLNSLLAAGLFVANRPVEALLTVATSGIIIGLALRTGNETVAQAARIT